MLVRMLAMLAVFTMASAVPAPAQTLDKAERICAAAKLKATAKKVNARMKCEAKAIVQELADPVPECIAKAEEKFGLAFSKAESKGGCLSDGDAASVEAAVDTFVATEVLRQETGTGGGLPSCQNLNQTCGSCGTGLCAELITGQGAFCIDTTFYPVTPCPTGGCPDGSTCISVAGQSACIRGCI